jgi:uncharacterized membrane protein
MSESVTPPAAPASTKEDSTVALLAYLTPLFFGVGIVIAIIMHNSKKTALGAYHLRQSLGLLLSCIVLQIAGMMVSFVLMMIPFIQLIVPLLWVGLGVGITILWIMGLIAAINGQQKPLPVVGAYYEKWFANAFV